jgi:ectoine hydroxylase-related dioxygenase (phytanoyl-CoA dioxygenase family)
MEDLASIHKPISNLFEYPSTREAWDAYRLSKEQIEHFHEYGYVSDIKLLNSSQILLLKEEMERIMDPNHEGNDLFYEFHSNESVNSESVLFHSLGHWRISEGFHDVLWNPAFLMAAHQLLDVKPIRFWHDQLFYKPAAHGGVVAWHQDYSYWTRTIAMQHLTCWTGLDDATTENGCLHYIPKSHQWGLLNAPELAGNMDGILDYLTAEQKVDFQPVPIELKAGYGTFHHPLLVHGSYQNTSNQPRRAFVLNVFADGTVSNTNDELLKGVPPIKKGEKMEGKFFPLLYP